MQLSDLSWHTSSGLRINIPLEEINFDLRGTDPDPVFFLATRVDNSYNLSRVLRTALLFIAFFNLSNPWATLLFTLGGFFLGYSYMFVRDYFPLSTLIDFFGMIYSCLFRFYFIIPSAVIITAIVTNSYLLIALYFISLVATFILRFVIDIAYSKFSLRRYGIALLTTDAKAARVIYQYGKAWRTMGFRTYYRHLISNMAESST